MTRTRSTHMVTILKLDAWQKRCTAMMLKNGKIDKLGKMEAGWTPLGIIEKDGKHYLIDHEGCGSFEPCDEIQDSIDWYEHNFNEAGQLVSFNTMPTARTSFVYKELVEEGILTKKRMRLDTFIRTGGSRLERNFGNVENFLNGKIDRQGNWLVQELKTA